MVILLSYRLRKNIMKFSYLFLVCCLNRIFTPLTFVFCSNQKIRPTTQAYFQLLRRALASGRALCCPSGKKKAFYAVLGQFWCPVVTLATFSSNLNNFENNKKKYIYYKKIQKNAKISKTRAETAPAMAIPSIMFSLFQPIPAIWSYLGLIGAIQSYLERFRAIQSYLELFRAIQSNLELFGAIWFDLAPI